MPQAVAFVLLVAAGVLVFRLLVRSRRRLMPEESVDESRRLSRRQRLVMELERANPNPEIPTVVELMHQEAAETGVDSIAGGEGIPIPVKLKVWRRDAVVHEDCTDRALLRFVVKAGVAPADATVTDVRLACGDRVADDPDRPDQPDPPQG